MEPLRDPNPSDVLEVRTAPRPFLDGLKSQKGPPRAAGGGRLGSRGSRGRPGGGGRSAQLPLCPCRTSMTACFPSGMRSWSWMRNGEKGRNKRGAGPWQPWGNQDGCCREPFAGREPQIPFRCLFNCRGARAGFVGVPWPGASQLLHCAGALPDPRLLDAFQVGHPEDQGTTDPTAPAAQNVQKERNSGVGA